nr:aldolase/citrate lyase family protein [uncultured Halomonas sp.]
MSSNLNWMLITANPAIAKYAETCDVQRIFVDMETLGKYERQKHLSAHNATHTLDDVSAVADVLEKAELMVRINPININTAYEIDGAIENGAERIMLPMFRSAKEVHEFLKLVNGRVPVTLLAETIQAVSRLPTYVESLNLRDEVYFGLNDLALDMKLSYLFEPLAARTFEFGAKLLSDHQIDFGFGGIARLGYGELPSKYVLSEHVRLGSRWAILSRAFHLNAKTLDELTSKINLPEELDKLRKEEKRLQESDDHTLENNRKILEKKVFEIAKEKCSDN